MKRPTEVEALAEGLPLVEFIFKPGDTRPVTLTVHADGGGGLVCKTSPGTALDMHEVHGVLQMMLLIVEVTANVRTARELDDLGDTIAGDDDAPW